MGRASDGEVIADSLAVPERFGEIFDRHAHAVYRYLGRRIGSQEAEGVLGDVFLAAFEHRGRYDSTRGSALPWLYGIASNLVGKFFRQQGVHLRAVAAVARAAMPAEDPTAAIPEGLDASTRLRGIAGVLEELPDGDRDALLLFAWEELTYEEIARALDIPVGTVRSRLNRARRRLRAAQDEFDTVRDIRPDRIRHLPDPTSTVLHREKERLMSAIDWNRAGAEDILRMPDVHARLAYRDEQAALEHLVRVFGLEEIREARTDLGDSILAFLRMGNGYFMIGRESPDVHRIHSPAQLGGSTTQMQVRVHDIDAHYERAVAAGADITMPLEDAFYGERRYEANDPEGHRWHFSEPFTDIRARGGDAPDLAV